MDSNHNTIYVFIDASNLWQAQKVKGRFLNWEKVIKYIKERYNGTDIKFFFYDAYPAEGTRGYNLDGKHKFYTYLQKGLNFVVVKKQLKRISIVDEHGESIEEKGNMDVELTIGAVHCLNRYEIAVFFTGDSDFLALVTYLKNHDKKVYIFSSKNNISYELKTGGNGYVDILDIEEIWGKELKHRAGLGKEGK
jgi:uncharacterized LabA/DUF88 family protein